MRSKGPSGQLLEGRVNQVKDPELIQEMMGSHGGKFCREGGRYRTVAMVPEELREEII